MTVQGGQPTETFWTTPHFGYDEPALAEGDPEDSESSSTSEGGVTNTSMSGDNAFVVLPDTCADAEDWMSVSSALRPTDRCEQDQEANSMANWNAQAYHTATRLTDGRSSLLLDIGSVGNLAGDLWVKKQAQEALKSGRTPSQQRRDRPLRVSGVGSGSTQCEYNCHLPVALPTVTGEVMEGSFETPTVPNSELPALLGLAAARKCRMIIDTSTLRAHMCGPGPYELEKVLPLGTQSFQCKLAPSGHMVLPCAQFGEETGQPALMQQIALPVERSECQMDPGGGRIQVDATGGISPEQPGLGDGRIQADVKED